jgi:hypothetical protein
MTTEAEYTEAFQSLLPQSEETVTPEQMTETLMRHELFEFDEDLDGVMTTLVDVPVYELHPQAYRITGKEAVREMYERTLPVFIQFDHRRHEVDTREIKCVAFSNNQMAAELAADFVFPDGETRRVHLTCIAEFSGDKVVGERLYLDHKLAELYDQALGPDFFELPGVTKL